MVILDENNSGTNSPDGGPDARERQERAELLPDCNIQKESTLHLLLRLRELNTTRIHRFNHPSFSESPSGASGLLDEPSPGERRRELAGWRAKTLRGSGGSIGDPAHVQTPRWRACTFNGFGRPPFICHYDTRVIRCRGPWAIANEPEMPCYDVSSAIALFGVVLPGLSVQ
jgi:hypothetical protein